MFAVISATVRLLLYVLWTLVMMPVYSVALLAGTGYRAISCFYWRMTAEHILRMKIVVRGALVPQRPLLCVANHVSYLDIIALGSFVQGSFVAKAEVRGWPGFGILARLARTVFIDRRQTAVARSRSQIADALRRGEPLILFPEGTSSDGNRVLSFRSSLFNVAEQDVDGQPVTVQPVSIAYTRHWGVPMGYGLRPLYAWYGDMDLATHLWEVLLEGGFTVEIDLLEPVTLAQCGDRKALARHCESAVRRGMNGALSGRPVVVPVPVAVTLPEVAASGSKAD